MSFRGLVDKSGEQFVAYFLPTEEALKKRRRDDENETGYEADDEYNYKLAREYTWNVKSKVNSGYEENYYFIMKEDGVYYNELETRFHLKDCLISNWTKCLIIILKYDFRVRLSKRRNKNNKITNTRLCVKYRPYNKLEQKNQVHFYFPIYLPNMYLFMKTIRWIKIEIEIKRFEDWTRKRGRWWRWWRRGRRGRS